MKQKLLFSLSLMFLLKGTLTAAPALSESCKEVNAIIHDENLSQYLPSSEPIRAIVLVDEIESSFGGGLYLITTDSEFCYAKIFTSPLKDTPLQVYFLSWDEI